MKAREAASFWFLFLLISLVGCGSNSQFPPSGPNISISPNNAVEGSADVVLTVTARGGLTFLDDVHDKSFVVWSVNNSDTVLPTTFKSSTQLTAVIPAALLASPATASVSVETGDPMGDSPLLRSNSVSFPVTTGSSGAASISSISPTSAVAGSADLTLTITGSNFDGAGVIRSRAVWIVGGSTTPLATTFVSDTQLTAVIPAALLASPLEAQVAVQHYDGIEDVVNGTSNSVSFSITSSVSETSSGFVLPGSMAIARSGHAAPLLQIGKVPVAGGDVTVRKLKKADRISGIIVRPATGLGSDQPLDPANKVS